MALPTSFSFNPSTTRVNGKGNRDDITLRFVGMYNGDYLYAAGGENYIISRNWNGDIGTWRNFVERDAFQNQSVQDEARKNPVMPTQVTPAPASNEKYWLPDEYGNPANVVTPTSTPSQPSLPTSSSPGVSSYKNAQGIWVDMKTGQPIAGQPTGQPAAAPAPQTPIDYTFHVGKETIDQYNQRIAAAQAARDRAATTQSPAPTAPQAPSVQMRRGQSGKEVLDLQNYLKSLGLLTQSQIDTGPGTFGPQTEAAVAALQQRLGVDNSSGPGVYGPRTIAAAQKQSPNIAPEQTMTGRFQQSPQYNSPTGATNTTVNTNGAWTSIVNSDPFISGLLNDATKKASFDAMPDEMKSIFLQTASALSKSIEAGKVVNPNINITPEQLSQFYNQAKTELDPYYTEQFNNLKGDLDLSLARLSENYTQSVQRAEDPFKQNLATQAESEAQQGTAFSSERNRRELTNVTNQTNALSDAYQTSQRSAQDLLRGYEGNVGTDRARQIGLPTLSPYSATTQGFSAGSARPLDSGLLGGISYGTVGANRETALQERKNELEQSYRTNRVLDYSKL